MGYDACKSLSAIPEANGRLLGNGWSRETRDSLSNGHGRFQDRAGITASWNDCWWVKNRNSASHTPRSLNNRRLFSENWSVKSTRVFQPWELMLECWKDSVSAAYPLHEDSWMDESWYVMVCHGGWCWLCWLGSLHVNPTVWNPTAPGCWVCVIWGWQGLKRNQTMGAYQSRHLAFWPLKIQHVSCKGTISKGHESSSNHLLSVDMLVFRGVSFDVNINRYTVRYTYVMKIVMLWVVWLKVGTSKRYTICVKKGAMNHFKHKCP